jgi:hypothetical protein
MQSVLEKIEEQHDYYTAALKGLQEASVDMAIAESNLGCVGSKIMKEATRLYREIRELRTAVGEQTKRLREEHRVECESRA